MYTVKIHKKFDKERSTFRDGADKTVPKIAAEFCQICALSNGEPSGTMSKNGSTYFAPSAVGTGGETGGRIEMSQNPRQSRSIRTQLLAAMQAGEYAHCDRLPRESVLSERLGISRTQLRDILASLDREGFITRRHGVGTIINRHVLGASARMDIEVEFLDMIRQSGHTPGVAFVRAANDKADNKVAAQLGIPAGTPILRISRLCTADGRPAIYCEDVVEKARLQRPYTAEELRQPIFDFLQEVCGVSSYLDLTDLRPVTADAVLADIFQVPQGTPLLNMDEVDYDIDGAPVFASSEYFADGIFHHTVLRKKL